MSTHEARIQRAVGLAEKLPPNVMAWINASYARQRGALLDELAIVAPTNTERIVELQRDVAAMDIAMGWLGTIIEEANAAQDEIERGQYAD